MTHRVGVIALVTLQVAFASLPVAAQSKDTKGGGGKRGGSGLGNYTMSPPANNVPEHLYNIVLGRPTDVSIAVRIRARSIPIYDSAESRWQ